MIRNEANARRLREANNAFRVIGNDKPMTDYAKAQQSFHENRERLKESGCGQLRSHRSFVT